MCEAPSHQNHDHDSDIGICEEIKFQYEKAEEEKEEEGEEGDEEAEEEGHEPVFAHAHAVHFHHFKQFFFFFEDDYVHENREK